MEDEDFYCVEAPTTYAIGPEVGPAYLPWDNSTKPEVGPEEITRLIARLNEFWDTIAESLPCKTRPVALTGDKARRLVVQVNLNELPPWGTWFVLSRIEAKRRTFTAFRASVNNVLSPHQVDHIDFI
jgi:hypothetical protein